MGVNRRVELSWSGESCSVMVTMDVIERLEEKLNLAKLAQDCATGNIKLSQASRLVATLLNEGGLSATIDEVFDGMFDGEGSDGGAVIEMVATILGAIFPAPKKKPSSSSKRQKSKA